MDAEQISREQHKPLSAAEIEELRRIGRGDYENDYVADFVRERMPRLLSMLRPTTDIPGAVDEAKAWMDASWASRLYQSAVRDCWETLVRAHTDLERELKMAASNRQEWMVACLEKQSELAALKSGPTDAAAREAVEVFEALPHQLHAIGPAYFAALHRAKAILLSYVRAAQSPRLTKEQVGALAKAIQLLHGQCSSCKHGWGLTEKPRKRRCVTCLRNVHESAWEPDSEYEEIRAAFPGVFGKEG